MQFDYTIFGHISKGLYILPSRFMSVMFIVVLFTTDKEWRQQRCPSRNEWIMIMQYIYIMDYYSGVKKNKL